MSTRTSLIKKAAVLPKGSEERRAILAGLKSSGWTKGVFDKEEVQDAFEGVHRAVKNTRFTLIKMSEENDRFARTYAAAGMEYREESKAAKETRALLSKAIGALEAAALELKF